MMMMCVRGKHKYYYQDQELRETAQGALKLRGSQHSRVMDTVSEQRLGLGLG
jgi:hypothetical protein